MATQSRSIHTRSLTSTPKAVVKPIHPNRIPVLLVGEDPHDAWINSAADEAMVLAKPYADGEMKVVAKGEKRDPG